MLSMIQVVPVEGGGYDVQNGDGEWIADAETREEAIDKAFEFAAAHGLSSITVHR